MSYSIATGYVQGIQSRLHGHGIVNYANEKVAAYDASALGQSLENHLAVDLGGLATEGASLRETEAIAGALYDMSKVASDADKKFIIVNCLASMPVLEKDASSKFAEAGTPGDNNVVAGHKPGHVAAGESSAKTTDHNKELVNAVSATVERPEHFDSMPGKQKDEDKGHLGVERDHEGKDAQGAVSKNLDKELTNAVSNTAKRPNMHGGPGDQKDEDKGHQGVEKSAQLSDVLARL